jgi:hypothetical protein
MFCHIDLQANTTEISYYMIRQSHWKCATYDDARAHCSSAVRDVLNNTYHDRRIGRAEGTAWPPRSPDLNPLDMWPVGAPKIPCVGSSCCHRRGISPYHCGWLSDCPKLHRHLRRDGFVLFETSWGMYWSHRGHLNTYMKYTLSAITNK